LQDGVWLLSYGLFGQVLGWLLIAYGLPHVKLSLAGFLLLIQPALAFIWGLLIFHEATNTIEVFGALITLFAIYLSSTSRRQKIKNRPPA